MTQSENNVAAANLIIRYSPAELYVLLDMEQSFKRVIDGLKHDQLNWSSNDDHLIIDLQKRGAEAQKALSEFKAAFTRIELALIKKK